MCSLQEILEDLLPSQSTTDWKHQTTEPQERHRQPLTVLRLGGRDERQLSVGDNDPSHSFPTPRDITFFKSPKVRQTMTKANTTERLTASSQNSYMPWLVLFLKDAGGSGRGMTQSPRSLDGWFNICIRVIPEIRQTLIS